MVSQQLLKMQSDIAVNSFIIAESLQKDTKEIIEEEPTKKEEPKEDKKEDTNHGWG